MLSPIDDLVARRNAIAHGVVDQIESVELSISRTEFLSAFVHATHELLRHELLPFEVDALGVQPLGRPIEVFNNKIACFESSICSLATGDRIVARTGDSLVPYREGKIVVIEVDNKRLKSLKLTEKTRFGLEVDFTVRKNNTFFVLQ